MNSSPGKKESYDNALFKDFEDEPPTTATLKKKKYRESEEKEKYLSLPKGKQKKYQ